MQPKLTVPPAVIFASLIRRAAAGLAHVKWAHCYRCQSQQPHTLAAETSTTGETIYKCPSCGAQVVL